MSHILEDLCLFLDQSPTPWHAVHEMGNRLASLDVTPLEEGDKWDLEKNKRYFVQRSGSLCAFSLPSNPPSRATIIGAHTDSPGLKLKPNPEIFSDSIYLLGTEIYGGPLLSSWYNRDLAIAGRIMVENSEGGIEEKLVFLDESPLFIPQLAIHLDRDVNDKGLIVDRQEHLRPILGFGEEKKNILENLLRQQASFKTLLSFDLFLVPLEKARFLGASDEMIASYRIDNLASTHACITAFASASSSNSLQMVALWDAEEIGSNTAEGAASPFIEDVLRRIAAFYKMNEEDFIRMKAKSLCVSSDVTHAFNPNFSKKHDEKHRLIPGKGIAIKYNANKKYITDAETAAVIALTCKNSNIPYQSFASHSNILNGSTIGPIFAHTLGIPTVDVGTPIYSMHSSREVISTEDYLHLCELLKTILSR